VVQDIESKGGYIKAFNSGYLTDLLKEQYLIKVKSLLKDQIKIIGVNAFAQKSETDKALAKKVEGSLMGWFENKTLASFIEKKL
jgi:methylmalonyl-CoA mutase N-terminal domain/subunit